MSENDHEHSGCNCACPTNESDILVSQAEAQTNLANFWIARNRLDIAGTFLAQSKNLLDHSGATAVPARVWYLTSMCEVASRQGEKHKAYDYSCEAYELAVAVFGADHSGTAITRCNLGELSIDTGRVQEGIDLIGSGLTVLRDPASVVGNFTADYLAGAVEGFSAVLERARPTKPADSAVSAGSAISGETTSE